MPNVYENDRRVILHERFVLVEGVVQNRDGVVHVRADRIAPLLVSLVEIASHDFH